MLRLQVEKFDLLVLFRLFCVFLFSLESLLEVALQLGHVLVRVALFSLEHVKPALSVAALTLLLHGWVTRVGYAERAIKGASSCRHE